MSRKANPLPGSACERPDAGKRGERPGYLVQHTSGGSGGLLDWVGDQPPTAQDVARRGILAWGDAHVGAIAEVTDRKVLGIAGLDDGDDPGYLRISHRGGGTVRLSRNGVLVRAATKEGARTLPLMSTWALLVLPELAEPVFVRGLRVQQGLRRATSFAHQRRRSPAAACRDLPR